MSTESGRRKMTVGELKKELQGWPDDYEITFSGVLEFSRLKGRGEKLVDMEFNQTVFRKADGSYDVTE